MMGEEERLGGEFSGPSSAVAVAAAAAVSSLPSLHSQTGQRRQTRMKIPLIWPPLDLHGVSREVCFQREVYIEVQSLF